MIEQKAPTFAVFGKPFQEKLVQLIVDDFSFAGQVGEVLNSEFFELKYLRVLTKRIYDYYDNYGKYPSRESIEAVLRTDLKNENETIQKQTRDFFARIMSDSIKGVDEEYVKDKSLDFCRKQKLKEALIKSVPMMEDANFDEISKIINDALKLGSSNDTGHEYIEQFEERYSLRNRKPVPTDWDVLNEYIQGGLGAGDLGVVIAATGGGKSLTLVHIAAAALKQGKNVVYYTLELSDEIVGLRFDSCLTGYPMTGIRQFKDEIYEDIKDIPGKLIIKEYATKSASTDTIKNHLTKLVSRNFNPDLVIIDYGDLLKPRRFSKEKRDDLESIYEELRGIAKEKEIPIWTASQTNRSGLNAEVITMESISEAYSKCFVADFIFSCSRTITDKQTNGGRIFIAKNRYGADGVICPMYMDTSKVEIDILPPTGATIEETEESSSKIQRQRLAEKYNSFKKKGEN